MLRGLLIGMAAVIAFEIVRVLFLGNTHEVVPGRVYRAAQLKPDELRNFIQKHNIRTVVNLRGCCSTFDWYLDECRVTSELNVSQEDITLSAVRLPPPSELHRLIDVLDRAEHPILLHCRQGADRTSLAAVVYLLLYTDASLSTALYQCSPRFAHLPILSTRTMDRFFEMYEAWLAQTGQSHAPARFRQWALEVYTPDPAPAELELLDAPGELRVGEACKLRIRAVNRSQSTWEFKPGTVAGVHARYVASNSSGVPVWILRAGQFERRVGPGEAIELDLPLPPFKQPGVYRVEIDLVDRHINFGQLGSRMLQRELVVR